MGKKNTARQREHRAAGVEHDGVALALRLTIGPMLVAHGVNKVAGGGGLEGTTRWFEGLGLRPGWLHARMAAGTEIGAGTLVTVGALAPLPEAAIVGLMATAAATDHRGKGFFVFKGGWEYVGVVGAVAATLAALGHGRWSVDALLGNRRRGWRAALFAVVFGLANAAGLLAASYRPNRPANDGGADGTGSSGAGASGAGSGGAGASGAGTSSPGSGSAASAGAGTAAGSADARATDGSANGSGPAVAGAGAESPAESG
jgi:putative oxidoreductase